MTFIYNQAGQIQLFCDTCEAKTDFYNTIAELLAAVHYNMPLTTDAGGSGWCDGIGRRIVGPGFQPTYQIDPTKALCPRCRGFFETTSYKSDWKLHQYDGKIGHIGDPAKTSRDEDQRMNSPLDPLFDGIVSKTHFPFPRNEPDFSNDSHYKPFGEQGEEGTG